MSSALGSLRAAASPQAWHLGDTDARSRWSSARRRANLRLDHRNGEMPMDKTAAILGSLVFFVIAPCTVAGLIPWWISHWRVGPAFFDLEVLRLVAVALIVAGAPGLIDSFARFALQGLGTPAPVAPPSRLVVSGLYRYVRNPMYVSLLAILFGEGLLFGDWRIFLWAAIFGFCTMAFVAGYEEPTLEHMFGDEYRTYRAHVPGWIPRLTPWRGA
jgi:protein-S-isoprenylcysteine O-methyltransferase Ste14